ncbi:hypothetical protein ACWGW2_25450, partial [Klebsiella pneumoniae]
SHRALSEHKTLSISWSHYQVYQLNKQLPAPIDCDTYHHFYDITDAGEIKVLL